MNKVEQKIESIKVVLENKVVSNYKVGVNGVTEIVIGYRQYSPDDIVNTFAIMEGDNVIEEITLGIPYIITYFKN